MAQIAVVEKFELHLHPIKVQIERNIGREIQEYISPKDKRKAKPNGVTSPVPSRTHSSQNGREELPRSRRSMDQSPTLAVPPRLVVPRTPSITNLRDSEGSITPTNENGEKHRTLTRSKSTSSFLAITQPATPAPAETLKSGPLTEAAEMRLRARKRTFLAIELES